MKTAVVHAPIGFVAQHPAQQSMAGRIVECDAGVQIEGRAE